MISLLVTILVGSIVGTLLLRLALWPAFSIAGVPRGRPLSLVSTCFLLALIWIAATTAWGIALIPFAWNGTAQTSYILTHLSSIPVFTAAGALCGLVGARSLPLPGLVRRAALAGAVVGVLFAIPLFITPTNALSPIGTLARLVPQLAWLVLPVAAVYRSAFAQRRLRDRYHRGACVLCEYPDVARLPLCTECGAPPRHLCHRCRRLVDARPGERCPHCKKATIASHCWHCGYSWTGIDAPRCPECGVWKPLAPEPPTNPATPPASLY